jgi:hypothetical protein
MKQRKPRYAKYELDRMSIRELKGLVSIIIITTTSIVGALPLTKGFGRVFAAQKTSI